MIKPCIVCEYPVEIEEAKAEVYVDQARLNTGDGSTNTIAVCGSKRCQPLVREVVAEEGRKQYRGRLR